MLKHLSSAFWLITPDRQQVRQVLLTSTWIIHLLPKILSYHLLNTVFYLGHSVPNLAAQLGYTLPAPAHVDYASGKGSPLFYFTWLGRFPLSSSSWFQAHESEKSLFDLPCPTISCWPFYLPIRIKWVQGTSLSYIWIPRLSPANNFWYPN